MSNLLDEIVAYLLDNGVDEGEVDYLVRQRIFAKQSIFDFVVEGNKHKAWAAAKSWVSGDTFDPYIEG